MYVFASALYCAISLAYTHFQSRPDTTVYSCIAMELTASARSTYILYAPCSEFFLSWLSLFPPFPLRLSLPLPVSPAGRSRIVAASFRCAAGCSTHACPACGRVFLEFIPM
ncbi:hypothetical protein B0H19DRAFT_1197040 [Mycena capillaripes]|nr:hypothetical protein B0H19DRAFT_1197040 [Mycena capillaripes]